MRCSVCGAEVPDGYNNCSACGAKVNTDDGQSQQNYYGQSYTNPGSINYGQNQPVSVGGWIGRSLIPLIPFVGWIIYIIMLIIWTGDQTKEVSFRNWAKAQLIVMGIMIGISLIIFVICFATGMLAAMSTSNYRYSGYYY